MQFLISTKQSLLLFAALFFLSVAGYPQNQSDSDTTQVYPLEETIISASRMEQEPSEVGRNVTVITRSELERSIHSSVGELLAEQQSIHVVGSGQTPGAIQSLYLRNADGDHTVVMIDGIRMSDPSTVDNSIDLSELSPANVERIEIVRGSHSTLYGSSAIGGAINIITRKEGTEGLSGTLQSQHGTFGSGTYSTNNQFSAGYTMDNGLYFTGSVFQQYTRGLDATVDTVTAANAFNPQDRDDFDKLDLAGKVGYESDRYSLHLSYRNADQRRELDGGAFDDDDNARIRFNRDMINYGASYQTGSNSEISFSGGYSGMNRDFVDDSSLVDRSGNYDGVFTETNAEGTLFENELNGRYLTDGFKLSAGLGHTRQTMNIRTFTLVRPFDFQSTTDLDSLDLEETISSAFVHAELGGRLVSDRLKPITLALGARVLDHNQFGTHLTYEINPKLQLTPSTLIYGAVTTGFDAPSLFQLHSPAEDFGAHTNRGNDQLDPETSVSFEAGWKQEVGETVDFNLSVFRTNVSNVIEYVYLWNQGRSINNLTFADYRGDTYINVSRQEITGIEGAVDALIGPRLRFRGNITYTQSTLIFSPGDIDRGYTGGHYVQVFESGIFVDEKKELEELTRRPSLSANLFLSYRPVSPLELSVNSTFVGSRNDISFDPALGPFGALDRSKIERYVLADLGARYEFNSNIKVGLKVKNILDTDYTEIRGFTTRGRSVYGKLSYSF